MSETSLDWIGRFKNPSLQKEFILHCTYQRSKLSFLSITVLLLSWVVVESIASTWFSCELSGKNQRSNEIYGIISLVLCALAFLLSAILSFSLLNLKDRLHYSYLQVLFILVMNFVFILKEIKYLQLPPSPCIPSEFLDYLTSKVPQEQLFMLQMFLQGANLPPSCPPVDSYPTLFNYQQFVVILCSFQMLSPILYEPRLYLLCIFHVITASLMLYSSYYSIYTVVPLLTGSISMITLSIQIHFQRVQSFLHQRKVQQLLEENQKNADANHAMEMRHMISNIAHDLKTPLASFTNGLDLIKDIIMTACQKMRNAPDKATEAKIAVEMFSECFASIQNCINSINNTNMFMLMTINRCIDYTKASKGMKLVPKYETVDVREALQFPIECMSNIQERIGIKVEAMSEEICSHIITDKQWLQENLLCLLSNAVKYSTEGSVTIKARLTKLVGVAAIRKHKESECESESLTRATEAVEKQAENGGCSVLSFMSMNKVLPVVSLESSDLSDAIVFEVEDTGIGLSEEAMKNLFNPFKQAQRLAGGTGLGLYSLAKRMEALKGRYGVRIREDGKQGSLFWFSIPYKADEVVAATLKEKETMYEKSLSVPAFIPLIKTVSSKVTNEAVATTLAGANSNNTYNATGNCTNAGYEILIVDDAPSILKMSSMMLKRQGHEIWTAENGEIALKRMEEKWRVSGKGFDLVLMDLQMPVMDGLEATRRLRGMELEGREWMVGIGSGKGVKVQQLIIGVSANSDYETSCDALAAGMNDFFSKPFALETFNKAVAKHLHE